VQGIRRALQVRGRRQPGAPVPGQSPGRGGPGFGPGVRGAGPAPHRSTRARTSGRTP
jgi:hypothetical protein